MKHTIPTTRASLLATMSFTALAALSVHGAVVPAPNYQTQDLFLTVRAGGGQGNTVSYLVNLGSYYQFSPASQIPPSLQSTFSGATPGSTFALNIGNIASDLSRLYGASWADRSDLTWGVIGTNNSLTSSFLITQERVGGNASTAFATASSQDSRNFFSGSISSVLIGINGFQGREATLDVYGAGTGSSRATEQADPLADNPGKDAFIEYQASTSFGGYLGTVDYEASFAANTAQDLWRYSPNSGITNAGYFTFSEAGVLSFTAIPEPSTMLLALGGAVSLVAGRRRQS